MIKDAPTPVNGRAEVRAETRPDTRVDAYSPKEIAERAVQMGVRKANLGALPMFVQAIMAGGFISVGALFATITGAGASGILSYGVTRLLVGFVFSLGLILIVLGGAELFTGNNLIMIAWASGKVKLRAVIRNWIIVYAGNMVGSLITALLVFVSQEHTFGGGAVGQAALSIAAHKAEIDFLPALALGILCNALVCMAVWLTLGARTATDKILVIIFPITAFVAASFEHSVANMYFMPIGLLIKTFDPAFVTNFAANISLDGLTLMSFINNLIPVTIGNIIGGVVMVGALYWFVYLRDNHL